jgi:hypothetical protein
MLGARIRQRLAAGIRIGDAGALLLALEEIIAREWVGTLIAAAKGEQARGTEQDETDRSRAFHGKILSKPPYR